MGRIAGVTAEETRQRLLASAAAHFAEHGYDGAKIADIAAEAGVTGGAIYAHFPAKVELLAAALDLYGDDQIDDLLTVEPDQRDTVAIIERTGQALNHRSYADGALLVEAIVAARRHPEVAELLIESFRARERELNELLIADQHAGAVGPAVRTEAVARFLVMLSLGSLLVTAMDLPPVDDEDWAAVITDLATRFKPSPRPANRPDNSTDSPDAGGHADAAGHAPTEET